MDIMMRLKGAGFSVIANEFRQREKRLGTGLPLQDFIEIVLQGLPKPKTPEEKYTNISALVDLFEDMDINGDGTMEFDEFTSYCVDAGMVATRTKTTNLKHRYVRNPRHVIKTMNGSLGVEKVRWSPLFKRFLVLENAAKSVKLFNADGYMVGEVRSQSTLLNTPPREGAVSPRANSGAEQRLNETEDSSRRDVSPAKLSRGRDRAAPMAIDGASSADAISVTANSGIFILDAAFLHKFQCLAMSTTDFVISFYNMEEPRHQLRLGSTSNTAAASARSSPSYEVVPKLTITTTTAQLLLRFCEEPGLLFSAGNDFIVNVWKIINLETKVLYKRLIHHQDMIMDVLEIPVHDMIASCDLNHTIQLWDIHDCRQRGALVGHTRGIKQMVFSKDHDMLLTAGFEFDAYGWDIASRQVVMKLVGHRAPLVGVQLAQFQTERAVTVDSSGVIKVWDISRASGGTLQSGSIRSSSRQGGRGASHATVLESLDPSHELSRFEPTTFISLHPLRRDLWTAASGSATLHLFRSTRVQQFDEIPLKAFYHYNANRFVVVSGPVCSIWDGEHGVCVDEFANVGAFMRGSTHISAGDHGHGATNHNGTGATPSTDSSTDILQCVQDAKCKKLVILSEEGELGVFNSQNFVQMRKCEETFRSPPPSAVASGTSPPPASCGIVGLHYCSENKLIIVTDSHKSSILVVDDSNNDSSKDIRQTQVLRRLVHIPGGIVASAYSYHASMVATLDHETSSKIMLWDFETLAPVGTCELEAEGINAGVSFNLLSFWDAYPVLLASDSQGAVYFFAVMPTVQAKTGKLLHAFVNDHTYISSERDQSSQPSDPDVQGRDNGSSMDVGTLMTQGAESAARKFLLKRSSLHKATSNRKAPMIDSKSNGTLENHHQEARGGVVNCMQVVFDESDDQHRYLLFTADDCGVIRVWNLSDMMRRLSIFKIPESNSKYLRRGYHPRAMFAHDCNKQMNVKGSEGTQESGADASSDLKSRFKLKKLAKQRSEAKKKSNTGQNSQLAKLLPGNRVSHGQAPPSATTVAAAEAFLAANTESTLRRLTGVGSENNFRSTGSDYQKRLLESGAMVNTRLKPTENRRGSQCWMNSDVKIVSVWSAHSDGITSMEVSRHPNIVVTCSLDMRVFVWNWQGACLGKLFDAENQGPYRWKFCKDDLRREAERRLLLEELIQELDLSPLQKAHRRRETLYQSHVQRKTQKELPHVSAMLLEHIVSQHPEVVAMEKDGLSSFSTDEKINAEMEKARQRNFRAKASMLETLARASSTPLTTPTTKTIARIHSLAQVGPLLCVDKFEMRQELAQMKFAEKEELMMDRQYLSDELAIGVEFSASQGRRRKSDVASIKCEIQKAQRHAEDMMENKIALQRHALSIYSNLRLGQRKNRHQKNEALLLTMQTGLAELSEFDSTRTLDQKHLEELLEPSPFLRSKLPEGALSIRPQTAPSKVGLSTIKSQNDIRVPNDARLWRRKIPGDSRGSKKFERPLAVSASEATLVRPNSSLGIRKNSLDQMYLDELQRQRKHKCIVQRQSAPEDGADSALEPETDSAQNSSLRKLESINSIISQAQQMCNLSSMTRTTEDEFGHLSRLHAGEVTPSLTMSDNSGASRARSTSLETLHETEVAHLATNNTLAGYDESRLRSHLIATQRRMDDAMGGCEQVGRVSSKRSLLNRQRDQVEHQKKGKRMEDYLQQKRREMNTNIGAVFKRTSFAFPTAGAANDATTENPGGKQRKKALKNSTTSEFIDHRAVQEAHAKVEKSKVFGIYGVKEVMSIIRLFWSMDEDGSGSLTLSELLSYKSYFEKLGYHDMTTVFQAIDKDGSGNITLKELLEICFQYATKYQVEEMLKLAKLGDVAAYFDATRNRNNKKGGSIAINLAKDHDQDTTKPKHDVNLSAEDRAELLAIFRVFDRNGDGGIAMDEIMEALHVHEDESLARVEAAEEAQLAQREAAIGIPKRRSSSSVSNSPPRRSSAAFTRAEVLDIFDEVDKDGDKTLDFEEFVLLMRLLYGPK